MSVTDGAVLTVIRPGGGDVVPIPGFGAVFKLTSRTTGGLVSIIEHPFPVGTITAAHRHTREDEHSYVLAGEIGFRSDDDEVVLGPGGYITKPRGRCTPCGMPEPNPAGSSKSSLPAAVSRSTSASWVSCSCQGQQRRNLMHPFMSRSDLSSWRKGTA